MIGSAPAIPKIHPVFATQSTLSSVADEDDVDVTYKEGAFSIDAAIPQPGTGQHHEQFPGSRSEHQVPLQQPPAHGWTVRALYDFEGQPEFSELSFSAGDVLIVVKVGLAEGWSLAEKDGVKGLIPEAYVTVSVDSILNVLVTRICRSYRSRSSLCLNVAFENSISTTFLRHLGILVGIPIKHRPLRLTLDIPPQLFKEETVRIPGIVSLENASLIDSAGL